MQDKGRYSMFIGRFQPFHDGHRWLIDQRLKLGKRVLIAAMDIHDSEPEKNPFPIDDVLVRIRDVFSEEIQQGLVEVISIPPIESVNYGRTVGYEVIEHVPPEDIKAISATNIRKRMKK